MHLSARKNRPLDREANQKKRDTPLIIIAAEGECTEKDYFSIFDDIRVQVKVLETTEDSDSAPEYVIERIDYYIREYEIGEGDQFWLMIDVDRWGARKLAQVTREAVSKGVLLAISNPCFEVWLLCHFQAPCNPSITDKCKSVETIVRSALGGSYNKSNLNIEQFKPHIETAVANATASDSNPGARWPNNCGETHVYKAVEAIKACALGKGY